jgi:hypothetical protein
MRTANLQLRNEIIELQKNGKNKWEIMNILNLSQNKYHYLNLNDDQIEKRQEWVRAFNLKQRQKPFFKLENNIQRFQKKSFCEKPFHAKDVIEKFGESPVCYLTGLPIDYENTETYQLDHFIPLSAGGNSSLENLRLCHPIANAMKRDFDMETLLRFCQLIISNHVKGDI